jgi:hypothetical protein
LPDAAGPSIAIAVRELLMARKVIADGTLYATSIAISLQNDG